MRSGYYDPNDPTISVYFSLRQDTPGIDYDYAFGSAHASLCNMVFCDGSVQAMSYSIDLEVHRRLCNRKDGLVINAGKY